MNETTMKMAIEINAEMRRAAELEGVSIAAFAEKAISIHARKMLARRKALPLLKPEPWRKFRAHDAGCVSFRVRVPYEFMMNLAVIEEKAQESAGGNEDFDICKQAEVRLWGALQKLKQTPDDYKRHIGKMLALMREIEELES